MIADHYEDCMRGLALIRRRAVAVAEAYREGTRIEAEGKDVTALKRRYDLLYAAWRESREGSERLSVAIVREWSAYIDLYGITEEIRAEIRAVWDEALAVSRITDELAGIPPLEPTGVMKEWLGY